MIRVSTACWASPTKQGISAATYWASAPLATSTACSKVLRNGSGSLVMVIFHTLIVGLIAWLGSATGLPVCFGLWSCHMLHQDLLLLSHHLEELLCSSTSCGWAIFNFFYGLGSSVLVPAFSTRLWVPHTRCSFQASSHWEKEAQISTASWRVAFT